MKSNTTKPEGPRARVQAFIERRREDAGEFVSMRTLNDGYVRVEFEKGTYFTPLDGKAVYKDGSHYERPPLSGT